MYIYTHMQTHALQPISLYKHDFYPNNILSLKYTQLLKAWLGENSYKDNHKKLWNILYKASSWFFIYLNPFIYSSLKEPYNLLGNE